ncbi:hypothetical protein GCM10025868_26240 [Angustibacter aerolatus]|uniref:Phosphoribosylformylglycinamidine synthase I n=1 Tax=Angustibacter aerolatus TaxID=1162965 RepID=A0ABQ6JHR5_9ACTN|nr:phosphoribosylformylglycinamidine synthase subunit PurQ [Angustibacter aerolatus]GMA87374.1 hypothetical protein GCM10025868_26240 [Angustibacter aerolatus]
MDQRVRGRPAGRRPAEERRGWLRRRRAHARRARGRGRVVARYVGDNPNGSYRAIAGVSNAAGNVVGLMPHPEHAVEPGFGPDPRSGTDGVDGLPFFTSVVRHLEGLVTA